MGIGQPTLHTVLVSHIVRFTKKKKKTRSVITILLLEAVAYAENFHGGVSFSGI